MASPWRPRGRASSSRGDRQCSSRDRANSHARRSPRVEQRALELAVVLRRLRGSAGATASSRRRPPCRVLFFSPQDHDAALAEARGATASESRRRRLPLLYLSLSCSNLGVRASVASIDVMLSPRQATRSDAAGGEPAPGRAFEQDAAASNSAAPGRDREEKRPHGEAGACARRARWRYIVGVGARKARPQGLDFCCLQEYALPVVRLSVGRNAARASQR